MSSPRIHLLSTINSAYLVPFRVAAQSLASCRALTTPITWHVFEHDLSTEDKAIVEAQCARSAIDIAWYRSTFELLTDLPVSGRSEVSMYVRLVALDRLPSSLTRVIYLDGDLLFLDAIDDLWNTDISGSVVGAVQDAVIPWVSSPMGLRRHRELGYRPTDPYFNAGVLVVDLDAWKSGRVEEKAIAYLQRHQRAVNMADQDALNAVLRGRWTRLADRWNIIGGAAGRAHFRPRGVEQARITAAVDDPAIIHFAGYLKPWLYSGLGSLWARAYADCLTQVCPDHTFERSARARVTSFYDRSLRTYLYPLERLAWRASHYRR
ncbi:MAG: glycosyltransferase family 8 protein [Vicinamibacterales bacterium]